MRLYHHKTDGGAEYLTNTCILWKHNGKSGKEGVINDKTKYIVRIDGDITKDAELIVKKGGDKKMKDQDKTEILTRLLKYASKCATAIRNDWTDPRSDCREIWEATARGRELLGDLGEGTGYRHYEDSATLSTEEWLAQKEAGKKLTS